MIRLLLILSIFMSACGDGGLQNPFESEEADCPDTQIILPDDRDSGWEPEPEPPRQGAVTWAQLKNGALESACLSCHRGDRSFENEQNFRNSDALALITTGDMPPNRVLSQKEYDDFGGFFSQLATQDYAAYFLTAWERVMEITSF